MLPIKSLIAMITIALLSAACSYKGRTEGGPPDCAINNGPCLKTTESGAYQASLSLTPRPAHTMMNMDCSMALSEKGSPMTDAALEADFTMPGMYMGINKFTLRHQGNGIYNSACVLPRCPSGGRLWRAEVTITRGAATDRAVFVFEMN